MVESHQVSQHVRPEQDIAFLFDPPDRLRHLIVALIQIGKDWSIARLSQFRPNLRLMFTKVLDYGIGKLVRYIQNQLAAVDIKNAALGFDLGQQVCHIHNSIFLRLGASIAADSSPPTSVSFPVSCIVLGKAERKLSLDYAWLVTGLYSFPRLF